MKISVFAAFVIALVTAFGVYRSCTRYRETMWASLTIDMIVLCLLIAAASYSGAPQ